MLRNSFHIYFVCLHIQCAHALVEMEAPVQLLTLALVLQDGVEHSVQQVLCHLFTARAYFAVGHVYYVNIGDLRISGTCNA